MKNSKTTKQTQRNTSHNTQGQATNAANTRESNTVKNPDEWTTGDEEMTGAQRSYLKTLSDEAGEEPDETLTKAEASKRIDELQHETGRGLNKDEK